MENTQEILSLRSQIDQTKAQLKEMQTVYNQRLMELQEDMINRDIDSFRIDDFTIELKTVDSKTKLNNPEKYRQIVNKLHDHGVVVDEVLAKELLHFETDVQPKSKIVIKK